MRIAIACDHAGFPLKAAVIETVQAAGHTVLDLGTHNTEPVDYPDYAEKAPSKTQPRLRRTSSSGMDIPS